MNTPSAEGLLPCPFCGGGGYWRQGRCDPSFYIACKNCETIGPVTITLATAIAAWNRRTTSAKRLPELPDANIWCEEASLKWFLDGKGYVLPCATKSAAWDHTSAGLYTADQMRAYGELCRRTASPAEGRMGAYDRPLIEDMLNQFADALESGELDGAGRYTEASIREQADLLRDANNAEAAGVHTARLTSPADSPATLGPVAEVLIVDSDRGERIGRVQWTGGEFDPLPDLKRGDFLYRQPTASPVDDLARNLVATIDNECEAVTSPLVWSAKEALQSALLRTLAKKPEGRAVAWRVECASDGSGQPGHVTLDTERGAMLRANEVMAAGCIVVNVHPLSYTITPAAEQGEGEHG